MALLMIIVITFNVLAVVPGNLDLKNETGPCSDQDVWVYIKHTKFYEPPSIVIVHIPKHSLIGDLSNCPAQDTTVVGEGRRGLLLKQFAGMSIVTLKKGKLNDSKNYTTRPPKRIEIPANNFNVWHVSK